MKYLLFVIICIACCTSCAVDRAHGVLAKAGTYAPHDGRTLTTEPYLQK